MDNHILFPSFLLFHIRKFLLKHTCRTFGIKYVQIVAIYEKTVYICIVSNPTLIKHVMSDTDQGLHILTSHF